MTNKEILKYKQAELNNSYEKKRSNHTFKIPELVKAQLHLGCGFLYLFFDNGVNGWTRQIDFKNDFETVFFTEIFKSL